VNSAKKNIVILGAGESGCGAAVLAGRKGCSVFLSDKGAIDNKYKTTLSAEGIPFEEGKHTLSKILNADEIIKSPGIPDNSDVVLAANQQKIPVISEIEFASRYTNAKKVCVTGTNGKTTTTLLTYHILKNAGFNVGIAGNIGKSFAMQVAESDKDWYVLELSSFQLDGLNKFKADYAIMLNITPDHLDRYDDELQNYINSKFKIINNQTAGDAFIYCFDDEIIINELKTRSISSTAYPFSIKTTVDMAGFIDNKQLNIHTKNQQMHMSLFELALQGKHNIYNSLASGIAARLLDIRKETVRDSLADFKNIEHRLEYVMTVHGIDFVNDSKATNVNSTWYALESMEKPVVWIVGGVDKGNDYDMLKDLVRAKVKKIICLGIDNKKIIKAYKDIIPDIVEVKTAEDAVNMSYKLGSSGDVVLLSPACASFDLFDNYEDRGHKFKLSVKAL
jgi:UDP-N-acetylmuramoylalanine--D-glutamate ligase